ncbi:hypothetical protein PT974_06322 [Cladobotryum mycophilum]|uniref:SMODS and SLOG-associating 2TM effector domain-containing protein n=1 Tax=Cladobotryum mycophilum TaxID=491253 RepID=A0ABR0SLX5_9HYPO
MPSITNSTQHEGDQQSTEPTEARISQNDRGWGDMRGRQASEISQPRVIQIHVCWISWLRLTEEVGGAIGRVDYLVLAHMYDLNPSRQSSTPSPPHMATAHNSPTDDDQGSTTTDRPCPTAHRMGRPLRLPPRPPNFTSEEHTYLHGRLPIRQPATAQTVITHFRRLPFLYQDLAEASRARLAELTPSGNEREREKRQRIATLAQRLANRYHNFRLALPKSYMEESISRWQSEPRASKFWEKVLEQVEKGNNTYMIARLWILLFIVQSSLVALAMRLLPTPGQIALLVANALAFIWSTTVMCEMLHANYTKVNVDEQELHDIIGGVRS